MTRSSFSFGNTFGQSNHGNEPDPGDYLVLDKNSERFGSKVESWVGSSYETCVSAGTTLRYLSSDNGSKIGQGINTRFDVYQGGLKAEDLPPDVNVQENITYAQYGSGNAAYKQAPNASHPAQAIRRVLIMPIVNKSEINAGNVTINRFGLFFLKRKANNSGDLEVEFLTSRITHGNGAFNAGAGAGNQQITTAVLYR